MAPSSNIEEYFAARHSAGCAEDCWPWTGPKLNTGYGLACIDGRRVPATHIALMLDGRPRPDELFALHSCDNPICVNPHHLRWGTVRENAADMVARGRAVGRERHWTTLHPERRARGDTHGARLKPEKVLRGSANGIAKLTESDVHIIRSSSRLGVDLARDFGVSASAISNVRLRKTWGHI